MATTAMPIRFMRSCRVKRCFYSRPYSPCCHPGHLVSGSQAMSTAPLTANNIPNVVGNRVMKRVVRRQIAAYTCRVDDTAMTHLRGYAGGLTCDLSVQQSKSLHTSTCTRESQARLYAEYPEIVVGGTVDRGLSDPCTAK